MTRKRSAKPYWEMTTAELREATKQFDEEFVAEKSRPLTSEEQALWERAKAKTPVDDAPTEQTIAVRLEKTLLDRCTASRTCPKILEIMGSSEFWGLRASPDYVGTDARADLPLPGQDYWLSGYASPYAGPPREVPSLTRQLSLTEPGQRVEFRVTGGVQIGLDLDPSTFQAVRRPGLRGLMLAAEGVDRRP